MTGTTSPLAFPYPTGTDRVADGDNAIQSLAEAIDDYFVGAQSAIAYQPVAADQNEGSALMRRGYMVHLRLNFFINPLAVGGVFATIPAAYRPSVLVRFVGWNITTQREHPLYVNSNGNLGVDLAVAAANSIYGSISYALGAQTLVATQPAPPEPEPEPK